MLTGAELEDLLDRAAENLSTDFKARLDWSVNARKWATLRDAACFANARGGMLIFGVMESNASYAFPGLAADDPWPDVTQVNEQLRQNFDPPISCEAAVVDCKYGRFGVIATPEFPDIPHVCTTTRSEPGRPPSLRAGAIYVRSSATNCEESSPHEWRQIFERGLAKRGVSIAEILRHDRSRDEAQTEIQAQHTFTTPALGKFDSLRGVDIAPITPVQGLSLADLEDRFRRATVAHRGGHVFFPRRVDMLFQDPQSVERSPSGALYELIETEASTPVAASSAEVRRDGSISVRESLWEDRRWPQQHRLDLVALIKFGYAALWFANRFHTPMGIDSTAWSLGLVQPLGRQLYRQDYWQETVFEPLPYFATTDDDLWVQRIIRPAELDTINARVAVLDDAMDELMQYFGFPTSSIEYFKAKITAVNTWEPAWP
jgi:hypothetical protein